MRHILRALRRRLKSRTEAMAREPIIFDFTKGQVHRASETRKDLAETMYDRLAKRRTRVVKRVEGLPPHVVHPKT